MSFGLSIDRCWESICMMQMEKWFLILLTARTFYQNKQIFISILCAELLFRLNQRCVCFICSTHFHSVDLRELTNAQPNKQSIALIAIICVQSIWYFSKKDLHQKRILIFLGIDRFELFISFFFFSFNLSKQRSIEIIGTHIIQTTGWKKML